MKTKENAEDTKPKCDKEVNNPIDAVDLFEKLPEDMQDAILELMRTMLHNG